ncbi:MAG: hypothetical protein F6K56_37735, partial [Moorea sp. SIO3G5]|nr:hypothetical protein [Moorena sp. SIO3G5]
MFYQYFIDLFFYRQKVIKAYQISREVYSDAYQGYEKIKQIINEITQSQDNHRSLSEAELLDFKKKLRILPKLDLNYSDWLRQLESYSLTMKINAHNYSEKLQQIKEKLPKDEDLSFL